MSRKILREIIANCTMCGNPIYGMKETTEDNPEVKRTCMCYPSAPIHYHNYPQQYYNTLPNTWQTTNTWQTFTLPKYTAGISSYQGNTACASQ